MAGLDGLAHLGIILRAHLHIIATLEERIMWFYGASIGASRLAPFRSEGDVVPALQV